MPRRRIVSKRNLVYWWNAEISNLRQKCLRRRRLYTRSRKKGPPEACQMFWDEYKTKKNLKRALKGAKRASSKFLCDTVDCDI